MRYLIDFPETFALREPVLMGIDYKVSKARGKDLNLGLARTLDSYSKHQQDAINFALNPMTGLGENSGLDEQVVRAFTKALVAICVDRIDGNGTPRR